MQSQLRNGDVRDLAGVVVRDLHVECATDIFADHDGVDVLIDDAMCALPQELLDRLGEAHEGGRMTDSPKEGNQR